MIFPGILGGPGISPQKTVDDAFDLFLVGFCLVDAKSARVVPGQLNMAINISAANSGVSLR